MKVFQNKKIYALLYPGSNIKMVERNFKETRNMWTLKRDCYKILAFDEGENIDNIHKELSKNNTINDNEILYFYSSSKFPRFKLKDTKFKRCIKPEKATAFITSPILESTSYKEVYVFESKNAYFVVFKNDFMLNAYVDSIGCSILKLFEKYPKVFLFKSVPEKAELVHSGRIMLNNQADIICDAWNNKRKLIFDKNLDDYISENFLSKMTKEDFIQIKELLYSTDNQNVGLGLRTLASMDITPFIASVSWVISCNYDIVRKCNEWNATSVSLMRDKLKIRPYPNIWDINAFYNFAQSEEDKGIIKDIAFELANKYVVAQTNLDTLNSTMSNMGINITFNVTK